MLQFNAQGQRVREADCESGINRREEGINVGKTQRQEKTRWLRSNESEEKTGR